MFLAHSENGQGQAQSLAEHLRAVADRACRYASDIHEELTEAAEAAALLHDLGKYRDEFQEYLQKKRRASIETHHAVYGAALAFKNGWLGPAFAIAGHHAGLHDRETLQAFVKDQKYNACAQLDLLCERFTREIGSVPAKIHEPSFVRYSAKGDGWQRCAEFYIRMLFSILVDADFLDTAAHYEGADRQPQAFDPDSLLRQLIAEKSRKSGEGRLNELRHQIFDQCLEAARHAPGFFSLTVPTGGGKTLASMAFALTHAATNNLRRVIVVIPYLSIIEQTAAQYRRIFDPEASGIVVESHSAVAFPEDKGEDERSPLALAAENWDAPIIVTTSVQFIESLFANKPSRCRKLHNIARAVVVFDEAQTLPVHLLSPLLDVLRELQRNYGTSFLFSTATQPAFRRSKSLPEGFDAGEMREIVADPPKVFRALRRVRVHLPADGEALNWSCLAERLAAQKQVLCVVNLRRHAFELWQALHHFLPLEERETLFHLSSAMCAEHRLDVIGGIDGSPAGSIRDRLSKGLPCRVVSTQLVEAGVDLDFPVIYRALGPLDSIVQAAGRCNREGRLREGDVFVFRPADNGLPSGLYRTATDVTSALLQRTAAEDLTINHQLFADYFSRLFAATPTDYARSRESSIQDDRTELRFACVARKARVIREEGVSVVAPYKVGRELIAEIRNRTAVRGRPRFTRDDLRRLQRFMINLHERDFLLLKKLGLVTELLPNLQLYVLDESAYDGKLGALVRQRPTEDFIL